ncbi:MAG: serine protease [Bacteroidales bacterium]|nr:serine protease [Bacteroidales bacterium]
MRKGIKTLIAAALMSGASASGQELHNLIGVVRGSYTTEQKAQIESAADALIRNSYFTAGKKLRNEVSSFGSGFIVKADDGQRYIITNCHVVGDAEYVDFEIKNGSSNVILDRCKVIKRSVADDIAIVELPSGANVKGALEMTNDELKDGMDVISAGYPALVDNPSWQFGKGIISNPHVEESFMGDSVKIAAIQHTAQIDPGSSGSPLLIEKKGKYYVVGVNTWKAQRRENANFALPVETVKSVMKQGAEKKTLSAEGFQQALDAFVKGMNGTDFDSNTYKYISEGLYMSMKPTEMKDYLKNYSLTKPVQTIREGNVRKGLAMMVANVMYCRTKNQHGLSVISTTDEEGGKNVKMMAGKKEVSAIWKQRTDGQWQITTSGLMTDKGLDVYDGFVTNKEDWNRSFDLAALMPISQYAIKGMSFSSSRYAGSLMGGSTIEFGNIEVTNTDEIYDNGEKIEIDTKETKPTLNLLVHLGAQVPMAYHKLLIAPYAKAKAGICFCEAMGIVVGGDLGVKVGIVTKKKNCLYIFTNYDYRHFKDLGVDKLIKDSNISGLAVGLGIGI